MERKAIISIVKGTSSEIISKVDLYTFLERITTNENLIEKGQALKEAAQEDPAKYDLLKMGSNGFIIGEFSKRTIRNCEKYYPLLGFDIDHLPTLEENRRVWKALRSWKHTFLMMPSLSWKGIRLMVWTDADKELHGDYYEAIAGKISEITGIATKSKIRESLRGIGWDQKRIEDYLKQNPNIDDQTNDISRFWFYSGLPPKAIYLNKESETFSAADASGSLRISKPVKEDRDSEFDPIFTEAEKMEYLLQIIEDARIDITPGIQEWFKIGVGIAYEFGEEGREYYHRACQFHPDYNRKESDREYDRCLLKCHNNPRGEVVTIASFYHKAKEEYGIGIDWQDLAQKTGKKLVKKNGEPELFSEAAEKAVIAFCLNHGEEIDLIFDYYPGFSGEVFWGSAEQEIFDIIMKMKSKEMEIDLISVSSFTGLPLADLRAYSDHTSEHILTLCKVVYNDYLRRRIVAIASKYSDESKKKRSEAAKIIEDLQHELISLGDLENTDTERTLQDSLAETVSKINDIQRKMIEAGGKSILTGVPTGLKAEDELTGGYQPTDLIIMGARPGMGKTAKMLKTAREAAMMGFPVGIFSLEMGHTQLTTRMISMESGVDSTLIRNGQWTSDDTPYINGAIQTLNSLPIFIDDKPLASLDYIDRKAAKWVRRNGVKMIIIDYLTLIGYDGEFKGNNTKQVTVIADRLKALAKRLNIPVVALAQLSRAVEIRGGTKRPMLSDLRESGGIEQAADIVQFLYRPEYYQILEDEEGNSLKGVAEVIYAKHRNGALDTVYAAFDPATISFLDGDYKAIPIDEEEPF